MTTGYVEYKDFNGLERRFSIQFGSQNAVIYVWKTIDGLKRNTIFDGEYFGAYIPFPYRRGDGQFGEIHLVSGFVSPGIVAHEIEHLLFDWRETTQPAGDVGEIMAQLAGEVTDQFWNIWSINEQT